MKKILLVCLVLLIGVSGLYSFYALPTAMPLKMYELTVGIDFGLSEFILKEYVFAYPSWGGQYILSRLDWDGSLVKTIGLQSSIKVAEKGVLSLGVKVGIPQRAGIIEDYDWAKMHDNNLTFSGVWSHYSRHDNFLKSFFTCDFNYCIKEKGTIQLLYGVGFQFKMISLDAKDGYLQYTSATNPTSTPDQISPDPCYGLGISYSHYSFIPYLAGGVQLDLGTGLECTLFAAFSPFTWAVAVDNHWIRNIKFTDYLESDFSWSFTFRIGIILSKNMRINLLMNTYWQARAEGNTMIEDGINEQLSIDTGGASWFSYSGFLQIELKL